MPDNLLEGALDLHVHPAPDVKPRRLDDIALAQACLSVGMAGALIKSHVEPTASRAWLAARAVPGASMFGGIVLNRPVGGLNATAVDAMAAHEGKLGRIVWLPTRDAAHEAERKGRNCPVVQVTERGRPVPALGPVLEIIAAQGLWLASGHAAPEEALAVFRAARLAGCRRFLVTHATAPISDYRSDQLQEAVRLGAVTEICARNLFSITRSGSHRLDPARVQRALDAIRLVGPERAVLSSDLGDFRYPEPAVGLATAAQALLAAGLSEGELQTVICKQPRELLGLT